MAVDYYNNYDDDDDLDHGTRIMWWQCVQWRMSHGGNNDSSCGQVVVPMWMTDEIISMIESWYLSLLSMSVMKRQYSCTTTKSSSGEEWSWRPNKIRFGYYSIDTVVVTDTTMCKIVFSTLAVVVVVLVISEEWTSLWFYCYCYCYSYCDDYRYYLEDGDYY